MAGKQADGAGTIRKRSDGRWEARIQVGKDGGTGKVKRKSIYGRTQEEVRKKLTATAAAVDAAEYFEPSKATLGQWLTIWTRDYLDGVKVQTQRSYRNQVEEHIRPALGGVKLSELTPVMIKSFYNDLLRRGRKVRKKDANGKTVKDKSGNVLFESVPLSPKSVHNVHGVLSKCLADAVDMELIKTNPAVKLADKLPRVEKPPIHPLTDDQVKLFIKELETEPLKRLYQTILFTGMREMEACGLCWDCVDFEAGTITVKRQLVKQSRANGGYTVASPKNSKSRVITPAPVVMDYLKERKKEQAEERLAAGSAWEGWQNEREHKTALVFTMPNGASLRPQTVLRRYKVLAARIGAPDTCVHDLRHTFATLSIQNGADVKTISETLGHYSVAFTLDVYGHVSDKMRLDSAERMQNYIASIM